METVRILIINGSPKGEHGYTAKLLETVVSSLAGETYIDIDMLNLIESWKDMSLGAFQDFDYETGEVPTQVEAVFEKILWADGVIFASPTHWFNISSLMKVLIDFMAKREAPDFPFAGKCAAFLVSCEEDGGQAAISAMAAPLCHLGFSIPHFCMLFHNSSARSSEFDWQNIDLGLLGPNLARFCLTLKRGGFALDSGKNLLLPISVANAAE